MSTQTTIPRILEDLKTITNNNQLRDINEEQKNHRYLIATHGGWIMRFISFIDQFEITDPESHFEEVKDYGSLASGKNIKNTSIFNFDILIDKDNCKIISYNCTKCNSFEHLDELE